MDHWLDQNHNTEIKLKFKKKQALGWNIEN